MFGQTAPGITALSLARLAAFEVFEITGRIPVIDSLAEDGEKPQRVEGHVVFDKVGFSYVSFEGVRLRSGEKSHAFSICFVGFWRLCYNKKRRVLRFRNIARF